MSCGPNSNAHCDPAHLQEFTRIAARAAPIQTVKNEPQADGSQFTGCFTQLDSAKEHSTYAKCGQAEARLFSAPD